MQLGAIQIDLGTFTITYTPKDMNRTIALVLIAHLLLASCKSKEKTIVSPPVSNTVPPPPPPPPPAPIKTPTELTSLVGDTLVVLQLERTSCFGKCPVYKVRLLRNGKAEFHGSKYTEKIGNWYAQTEPNFLASIQAEATKIGFMKLANKYPTSEQDISDFPACKTYLRMPNMSEKFIYNKNDAPESLSNFEKFLDESFNKLEWKSAE